MATPIASVVAVRVLMTWHTVQGRGRPTTTYERLTVHPKVEGEDASATAARLGRTEIGRLLKSTGLARQFAARWEESKPSIHDFRAILQQRGYQTTVFDAQLRGRPKAVPNPDFAPLGMYCVVDLDLNQMPAHATGFDVFYDVKEARHLLREKAVKFWHGQGRRGGDKSRAAAAQAAKEAEIASQSSMFGFTYGVSNNHYDAEADLDDAEIVRKCLDEYQRHFLVVYARAPPNPIPEAARVSDGGGGWKHRQSPPAEMTAAQERREHERVRRETYAKRHPKQEM